MPFRCSCGSEFENGKKFAAHISHYASQGHQKVGWVDPEGNILPKKPRKKAAAPRKVVSIPQMREVALEGELAANTGVSTGKGKEKPVVNPFLVSVFRMIPMQATIYNTPVIWTSYACALLRGFPGSFEEFINVAALDFWLSRGINPFEELAVIFQEVPSKLEEKLALAIGGQPTADASGGEHEPDGTEFAEGIKRLYEELVDLGYLRKTEPFDKR
jgi:hypothetical protein